MRAFRAVAGGTATTALRAPTLPHQGLLGFRQTLQKSAVLGGAVIRPSAELGIRGMANRGGFGKNKQGTRKYKIKSWSALKRRFYKVKDGMKKMQAGTRHNAKNKSRRRRKQLVGMVPVFKPFVNKMKKLGFKGT
jgi:ribosomal protein L35